METIGSMPFGDIVKTFRKKKKVSQQDLSSKLGVHYNTMSKWERGICLPDSKSMVLELAKWLRLDENETRLLLEASLTALSPYWHVPYQRNPFFTGRTALLLWIHQQLNDKQKDPICQSYAISGLGGLGKTQLALEYAYQHAQEYCATFWVAAEAQETILSSFAIIAQQLQLPERTTNNLQQLTHAVLHWFSTHKEWLLIFDNVESISLLKPFIPIARQGAILMTTRLHALEGLAHSLKLPPFSQEEGLHFLLSRSKHIDVMAQMNSDDFPGDLLASATNLVKAMDGLPLALDQAGAYIERTGCSLVAYEQLFKSHQIRLLAERSGLAEHPYSVVQTFLFSFEQLTQSNAATTHLLHICALLAASDMPEELFTKSGSYLGPLLHPVLADPYLFNQAVEEALHYSLLIRNPQNHTFSMHRLVQAVLKETMSEQEQEQWIKRIIDALDETFPKVEQGIWVDCERLLPHALVCVGYTQSWLEPPLSLASLLLKTALYLVDRASYNEAEPLFQRAIYIREQALGLEHPDVAFALTGLATLYRNLGRYEMAEQLYRQALTIQEQSFGQEDLLIASSLNSLAILYGQQGKYSEAVPLFRRAIHIREQALGLEHPNVANPLNNLAILYRELGMYSEAEPLFLRAIDIWEQTLGLEQLNLANPLGNLAILYVDQCQYALAKPLYQRALRIREQALGYRHPDVAALLSNLAELERKQGDFEESERLSQQALAIWEQTVGPEHHLVAHALNNLANLCVEQGKYAEAEPLFQRTLHIREQALGLEHSDTAETLHDFAALRYTQAKFEEAGAFYCRALTIQEQSLGDLHSKTMQTRLHYASLLHNMGQHEEAEILESHCVIA